MVACLMQHFQPAEDVLHDMGAAQGPLRRTEPRALRAAGGGPPHGGGAARGAAVRAVR